MIHILFKTTGSSIVYSEGAAPDSYITVVEAGFGRQAPGHSYRESRNCYVLHYVVSGSGFCGAPAAPHVARAELHFWEEPIISGKNGSGTVFFSGCTMRCVFCQNREISRGEAGKLVSIERLAEIFLELQEKGANNINLVTPMHYAPQITSALDIARKNGLKGYNFSRGGMTAKEYIESFAESQGFWDKDKACQAYVIALGVNDIYNFEGHRHIFKRALINKKG